MQTAAYSHGSTLDKLTATPLKSFSAPCFPVIPLNSPVTLSTFLVFPAICPAWPRTFFTAAYIIKIKILANEKHSRYRNIIFCQRLCLSIVDCNEILTGLIDVLVVGGKTIDFSRLRITIFHNSFNSLFKTDLSQIWAYILSDPEMKMKRMSENWIRDVGFDKQT